MTVGSKDVVWSKVLAEMFTSVTGVDISASEVLATGERITNLERAFNIREGLTRKDDSLPDRFLKEPMPDGPSKGAVVNLDLMLDEYYEARGWDKVSGFPTREKLEQLRLVDISCGTGNLILEALETLIRLSKHIYGRYLYKEEWIEGYDIDDEALAILKCRAEKLFLKYGIKGELRLYNVNSLLHKFDKTYNIILGNPPYFGEKNNKEIFIEMKKSEFGQKYYEAKMDYFYFFIEKGLDILEEGGVLAYITTNYWLKADSATKLRKKIQNEADFIYINNYNKSVFKNALGQHNMISVLKKNSTGKSVNQISVVDEGKAYTSNNKDIYNHNGKILLADTRTIKILNDIYRHRTHFLNDLLNINQGIVSGCDKAFVFKEFVSEFSQYLKAFYKNKDIHQLHRGIKLL